LSISDFTCFNLDKSVCVCVEKGERREGEENEAQGREREGSTGEKKVKKVLSF